MRSRGLLGAAVTLMLIAGLISSVRPRSKEASDDETNQYRYARPTPSIAPAEQWEEHDGMKLAPCGLGELVVKRFQDILAEAKGRGAGTVRSMITGDDPLVIAAAMRILAERDPQEFIDRASDMAVTTFPNPAERDFLYLVVADNLARLDDPAVIPILDRFSRERPLVVDPCREHPFPLYPFPGQAEVGIGRIQGRQALERKEREVSDPAEAWVWAAMRVNSETGRASAFNSYLAQTGRIKLYGCLPHCLQAILEADPCTLGFEHCRSYLYFLTGLDSESSQNLYGVALSDEDRSRIVERIEPLFVHTDARVRNQAFWCIADLRLTDEELFALVLPYLEVHPGGVLQALTNAERLAALDHALPHLESADDSQRSATESSVSRIGEAAMPAVLEFLEGADDRAIEAFLPFLWGSHDSRAIPTLKRLQESENPNIRGKAEYGLKKFGAQ